MLKLSVTVEPLALSNCLYPLLDALGWEGDARALVEAQPYYIHHLDVNGLMNTMANLGYTSETRITSFAKLDARMIPVMFIDDDGTPCIVRTINEKVAFVYNGANDRFEEMEINAKFGTFIFFARQNMQSELDPRKPQRNWFTIILTRFRPLLVVLFVLSFFLTLLALLSPLAVIAIYKYLGSADSTTNLKFIAMGVVLLVFAETVYTLLRHHLQNFAGSRVNTLVSTEVLRRIFYLSPQQTETASLGAQVARVKDLTSVRAFIDGPAAMVLAEIPFIIILYVVLAVLAGDIVWIPVVAAVVMIILLALFIPWVRTTNEWASRSSVQKQEFLLELVGNYRQIRLIGARELWKKRYEELAAQSAIGVYKTSVINMVINNLSQGIISIAGAVTIAFGVLKVIQGDAPAAILFGLVMLVWRILNPLKSGFSVITQIFRIQKSVLQLNRLMAMDIEQLPSRGVHQLMHVKGDIVFQEVSLRYNAESAPALLGISFTIKAKECAILSGHDGSGKSTVMKLILGMYRAQAGKVLLDSYNIQQLNPLSIRRSLAYAPKKVDFFYGSIKENLLLGNPLATDKEIEQACIDSGLSQKLVDLPQGLTTSINEVWHSGPTSRLIILTRAFLQQGSILLLDTPELGLEESQIAHLISVITKNKGNRTMVIISNDKRMQVLADRIITFERGRVDSIRERTPIEGVVL